LGTHKTIFVLSCLKPWIFMVNNWTQSKVDATRDKPVLVFKICTSGVTRLQKNWRFRELWNMCRLQDNMYKKTFMLGPWRKLIWKQCTCLKMYLVEM
jgi:hypothetical protein